MQQLEAGAGLCRATALLSVRPVAAVIELGAVADMVHAALNAAHQFREEGVGAGGDQHPNSARLLELETARQCRRSVVKAFDRLLHLFPNRVADKAIVIDDVRNRRGGNARQAGNVLHGGHALPLLTQEIVDFFSFFCD